MKQEYKQPWIDALRSGEYEQGKYRLHNSTENTFCCLGVLAKINNLSLGGTSLGEQERDLVGLDYNDMCRLMGMNDSYDYSFNEIANYIEENL